MQEKNNNKIYFYAAYAVLVVGGGAALILSARPLSATVVALALFSFNLAAILFVLPHCMAFVERLRNAPAATPPTDTVLADSLRNIGSQLTTLSQRVDALAPKPRTIPATPAQLASNTFLHPSDLPAPAALSSLRQLAGAAPVRTVDTPPAAPVSVAPAPTPAAAPATLSSASSSFAVARPTPAAQLPLFDAASSVSPPPATTQVIGDVSVVVRASVGEDSVLCLRGEGGDLNWQEGIPMNYLGDDRWSWKASGVSQPVVCRIYLNDEISAFGDDLVLPPGASVDVTPSFPSITA